MNLKMRFMKIIKKDFSSESQNLYHTKRTALYLDIQREVNKMIDFIRYFIEDMVKEAIELPCVVMLNILK